MINFFLWFSTQLYFSIVNKLLRFQFKIVKCLSFSKICSYDNTMTLRHKDGTKGYKFTGFATNREFRGIRWNAAELRAIFHLSWSHDVPAFRRRFSDGHVASKLRVRHGRKFRAGKLHQWPNSSSFLFPSSPSFSNPYIARIVGLIKPEFN